MDQLDNVVGSDIDEDDLIAALKLANEGRGLVIDSLTKKLSTLENKIKALITEMGGDNGN